MVSREGIILKLPITYLLDTKMPGNFHDDALINPLFTYLGCIHIGTSTSPGTCIRVPVNTSLHVFQ